MLVLFALIVSMTSLAAAAVAGQVMVAMKPIRLLNDGRYADAERYLRTQVAQAQRPSVRNAGLYNLAVALHRQGRFEESLADLEKIYVAQLDPSLHGAANALYGWNLVFLRRDLDKAERCIQVSGPLAARATTRFALAYLMLLRGRRVEADTIIREVTSSPPDRREFLTTRGGSALVIDQRFESVIEEHLLGLCGYERGEMSLARRHFTKVAHSAHPSFYPRHATSLLAQIGGHLLPSHAA